MLQCPFRTTSAREDPARAALTTVTGCGPIVYQTHFSSQTGVVVNTLDWACRECTCLEWQDWDWPCTCAFAVGMGAGNGKGLAVAQVIEHGAATYYKVLHDELSRIGYRYVPPPSDHHFRTTLAAEKDAAAADDYDYLKVEVGAGNLAGGAAPKLLPPAPKKTTSAHGNQKHKRCVRFQPLSLPVTYAAISNLHPYP